MHPNGPQPIHRFFSGLTEYTFHTRLGVVDPPLVDYVSDLLTRFVRSDALTRVRDSRGRHIEHVAEMLLEAEQRVGEAKRELHRHIGDFTLFWTGLYPESVARKREASIDCLVDYQEQGKHAYWVASRIETGDDVCPPASVLERLSCRFELCAYGLQEIRREWERRDDNDTPSPIIFNDN